MADGGTDRHIAIAFSALCIITEDRTINKAASVGGRGGEFNQLKMSDPRNILREGQL